MCVCENGVVASHHQRAARRPAAAPEKKKNFRGLKSFLSKKKLQDFESFFSIIRGAKIVPVQYISE